jgi:alkanesulfonate monooxygenase SsuD/methylene tetrahydromethanopterin reductase-like flavin-dependent oxidoreductase (luciferase family)
MRLGLYYDLRNPGAARPWARVYAAALDRIAWADDEGLGAIWVTEHHGFADGYLPAPLTFCAAIAARTRRARIGTAVVVSPLMPAAALAEQAAVVDILSDGRLELGLGAGWRASEFTAFGADYRHRYEALEEAVRSLPDLWDSGTVTPAPVQRPLPVWVGARGPRGARLAGRTGAGLLWIDPDLMTPYLAGLAAAGPPALPRMGGLVNVFLADDPDRAWQAVRENGRRNRASYEDVGGASGREATFPKLRILTPAAAAAHIEELCAGLPVTDVFCFADIGGLDDDLADRHTELAVRELTPLLAEEGELR